MNKAAAALVCLLFFSMFASILPAQVSAEANDRFSLYLDGKQLQSECPPQLIHHTMLVPLRIVSEELGADVKWSQAQQSITVSKEQLTLQLGINNKEALVNGQKHVLDAAPLLMNGYTLIPVRFVSENLGLDVQWDSKSRSVLLKSASPTPPDSGNGSHPLSEISGIEFNDNTLKITAAGGSMKPAVSRMSDPNRLVVDIPDAALGRSVNGQEHGGQGGKIFLEHDYISSIRYSLFQTEPSTVRIVLDLKQEIAYESKAGEAAGEWQITLNSGSPSGEDAPTDPSSSIPDSGGIPAQPLTPIEPGGDLKQYIVVIDAGHGGSDPGATAASGKAEKDFTLPMALKAAELLEQNDQIKVYLTRDGDTYPELTERAALANELKADVFVSIHGNSFTENRAVTGTETHYTREDSKGFAEIMHRHLVEATGFKDRKVIQSNLIVTRKTTMPAVLLEIGFLSNPQEEQTMWDEQFQLRVAQSIADGIEDFLL